MPRRPYAPSARRRGMRGGGAAAGAVLVALVAVAGCASDGEPDSGPPPAGEPAATSTTPGGPVSDSTTPRDTTPTPDRDPARDRDLLDAERGHVGYVRWVTQHTGIDVNHVNDLGWTALLEAVILGDGGKDHQEIVALLLAADADPDIADKDGVTPLRHADNRGFTEIAALLERA